MIPDEAVEAALSTLMGATGKVRDQMRAALEAAAPHLMAGAWQEGHESGQAHPFSPDPNPYRKSPDARG